MSEFMHVVGFSGGIDSQACSLWVRRMHGEKNTILLNSDAGGNEHPVTVDFIRRYSETVHPVVVVKALVGDLGVVGKAGRGLTGERRHEFEDSDELTFDRLAYIKGRFPSRTAQFCTEFLKLVPIRRWVQENLSGPCIRYVGVRRDESTARSCAAYSEWDHYFGCQVIRPIVDWTKEQAFAYVQAAGEEFNPLYKMGFNRVGCAPCVNANKGDVRSWAARFPEMIDKVREWEARVGRTFFGPMVPGKEINWIDEVVAWSKTERGGKRLALPTVEEAAEAGRCVSKYGLCE